MAIDSGMLIDHVGDLPGLGEEERLASELHEMMSGAWAIRSCMEDGG